MYHTYKFYQSCLRMIFSIGDENPDPFGASVIYQLSEPHYHYRFMGEMVLRFIVKQIEKENPLDLDEDCLIQKLGELQESCKKESIQKTLEDIHKYLLEFTKNGELYGFLASRKIL